MTRQLLILIHLAGAIVWIGGMVFAQFCLRPAAAETLAPPQRLPLMAAALRRFLAGVALAVVLILASGGLLLGGGAFGALPAGWQAMAVLGVVMTIVFGLVWRVHFPRLARACAAADWPAAALALNAVRRLVVLNLVLSLATLVAAVSAR